MTWAQHDYDDIPGSYIFDGRMTVQGYSLNKMCMAFNSAENREEFSRDEEAYCRKFNLTEDQIEAVKGRDWLRLLQVGGNVYYLAKMATLFGENMQTIGSQMTGMTVEEFKQMLLDSGK